MSGPIAWMRRHSMLLGNLGLIVVMLVGLAYLSFGALSWRPLTGTYQVTVHFPISGGLQQTSGVTLRGASVGEVKSIQVQPKSVDVVVSIKDNAKINRNATVAALGLSAAGEQYVDFQPSTEDGPYLRDGDVIAVNQTRVATPFPDLLESSLNVIAQIDPVKLSSSISALDVALGQPGTNQLRALFDSGGTIFADLYRVLPQTTALINNAGTIFATTASIQPDFGSTVASISTVVNSAAASDRELRMLLNRGPSQLTSLGGSLDQIRNPVSDALTQLVDVARQGALRAPALANLLPSMRDAGVKSQAMFHNGAWWAMASLFPRPYCDYSITPTRPTKVLELTIPTNLYCVTQNPNQQTRGSVNAPRPPGDDTAGPPPGYDPNARTVPLDK